MKEILLIALPLIFAAAAFAWPNERTRPWLLPVAGVLHSALALWLLVNPPALAADAWFGFDPLARAVLPMVSLLFLVCSIYGVAYLQIRAERKNRIFVTALLVMLGLLSLALQAQNLGLLWVAAEATTLVTVPLLHFNGTARAFEASWKYLLVGGTGIALSLLGSFCLGYASLQGGGSGDLNFTALVAQGASLIASVAHHRVGAAARRLRHENGSRADAHLEAGRLRRSAGNGRRAARRRHDHDGVCRHPARETSCGRRRRRRDDRAHVAGVRIIFDARGRAVSAHHAGLQTDARVFER